MPCRGRRRAREPRPRARCEGRTSTEPPLEFAPARGPYRDHGHSFDPEDAVGVVPGPARVVLGTEPEAGRERERTRIAEQPRESARVARVLRVADARPSL